jgi:hypothetical protein
MKPEEDQPPQGWLDELDAIIAGSDRPEASEDDLLHLARQLNRELTPLRRMDRAAEQRRQRLLGRLRTTQRKQPVRARSLLLVAMLLIAVLVGGTVGMGTLWGAVSQVWSAATSLQQVQGVSLAQLARAHPGLHPLPLLPAPLPRDTAGAAYGVITDAQDPTLLKVFVADYQIAGRDVALYEQPTSFPLTSSAAQLVSIGNLDGQVFTDAAGNHALQWYQDGMECQLTSALPVERLVALASAFAPITDWDLVR